MSFNKLNWTVSKVLLLNGALTFIARNSETKTGFIKFYTRNSDYFNLIKEGSVVQFPQGYLPKAVQNTKTQQWTITMLFNFLTIIGDSEIVSEIVKPSPLLNQDIENAELVLENDNTELVKW